MLFWSNVPADLTEDTARDIFSAYGIVTACHVGRHAMQRAHDTHLPPPVFCTIEYATRKEAEKCVEGCKGKRTLGFAFLEFDD